MDVSVGRRLITRTKGLAMADYRLNDVFRFLQELKKKKKKDSLSKERIHLENMFSWKIQI